MFGTAKPLESRRNPGRFANFCRLLRLVFSTGPTGADGSTVALVQRCRFQKASQFSSRIHSSILLPNACMSRFGPGNSSGGRLLQGLRNRAGMTGWAEGTRVPPATRDEPESAADSLLKRSNTLWNNPQPQSSQKRRAQLLTHEWMQATVVGHGFTNSCNTRPQHPHSGQAYATRRCPLSSPGAAEIQLPAQ